MNEYGKDLSFMQNKNISALVPEQYAPAVETSIYKNVAYKHLNDAFREVIIEGVDVNTALRKAEEKLQQDIDEDQN